jgi:ribose transport system permease protein
MDPNRSGPLGNSNTPMMKFIKNNIIILVLFVICLIATFIFVPQFFSIQNIMNVARQISIIGVVSVGMMFVILTGGIDLSAGGVLALSGIVFSIMAQKGYDIGFAIAAALATGLLVGFLNGFGVLFFGIQPFIMTLATSSITSGLALFICNGIPIEFTRIVSPVIDFFGNGNYFGLPGPFIIFLIIAVCSFVALKYLPFGRYVYSIGGSFEGARLSGVRTSRIVLFVYMICSLCAAMGGIITACRLYVGHPTAGSGIALSSIAAIVIGGASLSGGRGNMIGTIVGVMLMTVISNILNIMGVASYNQDIIIGIIIIVAILISTKDLKEYFNQALRGL